MAVFLSGCSDKNSSDTKEDGSSPVSLATKTPEKLIPSDEKLIRDWVAFDEECNSQSNGGPGACDLRDKAQEAIEQRGYCSKFSYFHPSESESWQICDVVTGDTASEKSKFEKTLPMIVADAVREETERAKTPLLHAYEKAIAPLAHKEGMANAVTKCGIKGPSWRREVQAAIRASKNQARLGEMRNRLSAEDLASANDFYANSVKMPELWYLGGGERDEMEACRELADMPLVQNDAVFFP